MKRFKKGRGIESTLLYKLFKRRLRKPNKMSERQIRHSVKSLSKGINLLMANTPEDNRQQYNELYELKDHLLSCFANVINFAQHVDSEEDSEDWDQKTQLFEIHASITILKAICRSIISEDSDESELVLLATNLKSFCDNFLKSTKLFNVSIIGSDYGSEPSDTSHHASDSEPCDISDESQRN